MPDKYKKYRVSYQTCRANNDAERIMLSFCQTVTRDVLLLCERPVTVAMIEKFYQHLKKSSDYGGAINGYDELFYPDADIERVLADKYIMDEHGNILEEIKN